MLGIDVAVWLAILLSLGSAALCAVYGLARRSVDDGAVSDAAKVPSDRPGGGARSREADPS